MMATQHIACSIFILQSPKQWTGRIIHSMCYENHEKYLETNADIYMALLHIRSTPIGPGLPTLAILFFQQTDKRHTAQLLHETTKQDNDP